MHLDTTVTQERIIKAIEYFKTNWNRRATSEEIYNFVNNGVSKSVDFAQFSAAMKELKIRRRINSEKRDGVFSYFVPRTPEIILKVKKATKDMGKKKNYVLPRYPVKDELVDPTSFLAELERNIPGLNDDDGDSTPPPPAPTPDNSNDDVPDDDKILHDILLDDVNDDDEYDNDDDIENLEGFIDKMVDKLDDFIIPTPPAKVIAQYEHRIFDLKSEVLFLRKLTSSNKRMLQEEIRFLRKELATKDGLIRELSEQFYHENTVVAESNEPRTEKVNNAPLKVGDNNAPFMERVNHAPFMKDISKALIIGNRHVSEKLNQKKRKMVECFGDYLMHGLYSPEVYTKTSGGVSLCDILVPRNESKFGVGNAVADFDVGTKVNFRRLFEEFMRGSFVLSPMKELSNDMLIPTAAMENEHEKRRNSLVITSNENDSENNSLVKIEMTNGDRMSNEEMMKQHLIKHVHKNHFNIMENMGNYRGWLSLDMIDQIAPSMKRSADDKGTYYGTNEINILKLCGDMAEQVNSINVKLRDYHGQRNVIYDGGNVIYDDTCGLNLNTLPLTCKTNNILTNSFVNCRIAT